MSSWVHIAGYIEVDIPHNTCIQEKVQKYVEWAIKNVEGNCYSVTGSEGDAKFNVIPSKYKGWENYKYSGNTYSRATIFINSDLRDRETDDTMDELKFFVNNLKFYMDITRVHVDVDDKFLSVIGSYAENDYEQKENEELIVLPEIEEDENGCDKLFKIQYGNWEKWNNEIYNDYQRIKDAVECLSSLTPQKLEEALDDSKLADEISWEFTDRYKDWQKYVGNTHTEDTTNELVNC